MWVWLICAYAAVVTVDVIARVIPVVRGDASQAPGSVLLLLLLSIKTAAIVGGAIALLGFRARAVRLFAVSLVSTIASMIQGFPFYVQQYRAGLESGTTTTVSDEVSVSIVFAAWIGLEVAILGYAWLLRKQRVLH